MTTQSVKQQIVRLPAVRLTLLGLGFLVLATILFVLLASDDIGPPPNLQPAGEVDLASQAFTAESVLEFALDETAMVSIFYGLRDIDTSFLELSLSPADGESEVLLRSEGLRTDREGGGLWEQELLPGSYRLLLTAAQGQGTLAIYWNYQ